MHSFVTKFFIKARLMTPYRYADSENAYWTGFFTSRPSLKGYVRMMSGYYLVRHHAGFQSSGLSLSDTMMAPTYHQSEPSAHMDGTPLSYAGVPMVDVRYKWI